MSLTMQSLQRSTLVLPTPLKQYETSLLWSGMACYNTIEKTGRRLFSNKEIEMVQYPMHLSTIDYVEKVKYILYSEEPLIWSENDDLFICGSCANKNSAPLPRLAPPSASQKAQPRRHGGGQRQSNSALLSSARDPAEHFRSLLSKFSPPE